MAKFKSKGPRMIYLARIGLRVRFDKNGVYSTNDPRAIRHLEQHRAVELIQSKDEPSREPPPPESVPSVLPGEGEDADEQREANEETDDTYRDLKPADYSRQELDEIASEVGLEPNDYANKEAVAHAINER